MKKKSKTVGWGLDGGQPSTTKNHMVLRPGTPEEKKVGMYRETLQVGEAFVNFSAGGAGWGDPANRDPKAIDDDILDGLTTNDKNKMKEEKP